MYFHVVHTRSCFDRVMFSFLRLQNEDFTDEKIQFGIESVYIDSWMRRRIYDAFKEILESGVRHHLQVRKHCCLVGRFLT